MLAVLQALRGKTSAESGPKLARGVAHIRPKINNLLGPLHMSSAAGLVQLSVHTGKIALLHVIRFDRPLRIDKH